VDELDELAGKVLGELMKADVERKKSNPAVQKKAQGENAVGAATEQNDQNGANARGKGKQRKNNRNKNKKKNNNNNNADDKRPALRESAMTTNTKKNNNNADDKRPALREWATTTNANGESAADPAAVLKVNRLRSDLLQWAEKSSTWAKRVEVLNLTCKEKNIKCQDVLTQCEDLRTKQIRTIGHLRDLIHISDEQTRVENKKKEECNDWWRDVEVLDSEDERQKQWADLRMKDDEEQRAKKFKFYRRN